MHKELFNELRKDHEEVNGILEQLKATSKNAQKKREELFQKLKMELIPHMEAEEHILYPALKESKEALEHVLESLEEHHVSEMVLKELDKTSVSEENWGAKLSVFKDLVEHHVKEEEDKIFKDAEKYIDKERMQKVFDAFQKEKEKFFKNTIKFIEAH